MTIHDRKWPNSAAILPRCSRKRAPRSAPTPPWRASSRNIYKRKAERRDLSVLAVWLIYIISETETDVTQQKWRRSQRLPLHKGAAGLLAKRNALLTKNTLVKALRDLPVESISLDNGSEFSEFHAMEKELNAPVYFAEPHKPWQRGTNENTNGLLRFYFPKGCDFHSVTQDELDAVVRQINSRPRKCLGWRTPLEVFSSSCVALH